MYAKYGLLDNARAVFDSIVERSMVAWTTLVSGYARSDRKKMLWRCLEDVGEELVFMDFFFLRFSWTALISGSLDLYLNIYMVYGKS